MLQDAFVKVWERWDRVGSMERPGGYLFRTAMNRFRSRRRRRVLARSDEAMAGRTVRDPIDDSDERDRVLRALGKLPLRQRQAIVLTEYLGFGSDDAAQVLGVRSVTVRSLASQGRATLRERLGVGDE